MLSNSHHHHFDKICYLKKKLGLLYGHLATQAFAVSLLSVFVPIYLLSIGFTLQQVLLYLLVEWSVFGLFMPLYGKIIHRIGLKEVIYIRTPLFVIALLLLSMLASDEGLRNWYLVIALIKGMSGGMYTLSVTSIFAQALGHKKHSEKTATFIVMPKVTSIIGPVLGGITIASFGFTTLFFITIIILTISLVPLTLIRHNVDHPPFKLDHVAYLFKQRKEFVLLNAHGIKGIVFGIVLPIVLYYNSETVVSLGILASLIVLIDSLVTFFLGRFTDRHGIANMLKIGAIITAVCFLVLSILSESPMLLYVSLVVGIVGAMMNVPYETHLYNQSKKRKHSAIEYLAFKEFSLFYGRLFLFVLLLLMSTQLDIAFYLGGISVLAFLSYK